MSASLSTSIHVQQLGDNRLTTQLAAMQQTLLDIKGSYQLIGGSNVLYFVNQTANSYDLTGTIGSGQTLNFYVTATAQNMSTFLGVLVPYLYVDTSTNFYSNGQMLTDVVGTTNRPVTTGVYSNPSATVTQQQKSWQIQLTTNGSAPSRTFYIKLYVIGLDNATLTFGSM